MWSIFKAKKVPESLRGTEVYDYRLGRRFDPGAPGEVFSPVFNNPVVLFRGRARLAGTLSKFQPPQVNVLASIGVIGLGGIQAGQYVGQSLIDPSQLDNEGGGSQD
jgi:hypothetical protein